ncbi:MAG: hypothetical protein J2O46_07100 [Nocardioides sp.]|nr:hypothetical protein [Nocardioides sp.]
MSWTNHHKRGEILHTVISTVNERRDGLLPMDLPGVADTFHGEIDVLAALQLRWHTRLAGHIDQELVAQPMDLESAVVSAWHTTADELPGVRAVLDHYRALPTGEQMSEALAKFEAKDQRTLAVMAGKGAWGDDETVRLGSLIEMRARAEYTPPAEAEARSALSGMFDRIRSVLAA